MLAKMEVATYVNGFTEVIATISDSIFLNLQIHQLMSQVLPSPKGTILDKIKSTTRWITLKGTPQSFYQSWWEKASLRSLCVREAGRQ
jgi:hypothetical protein